MAVFKVNEDFYVDGDEINGVRWLPKDGDREAFGIAVIGKTKITFHDKEEWDKVRDAFLWVRGQIIYDGKKKITV